MNCVDLVRDEDMNMNPMHLSELFDGFAQGAKRLPRQPCWLAERMTNAQSSMVSEEGMSRVSGRVRSSGVAEWRSAEWRSGGWLRGRCAEL